MAYNANIPQPTDRIKASQNDLLQNFQSVSTWVGIDHITFDDVSGNQGKHNTVSFPNYTGGAASPPAAADEVKLFAKAVSGITQLFLLPETGDSLTAERNISGGTRATTGEMTLPSGINVKWGRSTTAGGGSVTITYANAFTSAYTVYTSIAVVGGSNSSANDVLIRVYDFDANGFSAVGYKVDQTRQAVPFHWLALGI